MHTLRYSLEQLISKYLLKSRGWVSPAVRISGIYLVTGALWILFSDSVLELLAGDDTAALILAEKFKGWLFILTTSTFLYLLLKRELNARIKSDEARQHEAAKFRDLFAENPLPIWVYDRTTLGFLDVNDAACTHYGYTRAEFLVMKITDLRPPEEVPRLLDYLEQAKIGFRFAGEWQHLTKDGRVIDVETSAHMLDYGGQEAILVAIQDITERKRIAAERLENENLRLMLAKENEVRAMRNRFISMVSHEFRRPLTTITTSIELLENYRSRMTDEAAQNHFARIHEQLGEMKELLDDFLGLMRNEAAQQDFTPNPVELTELCKKLVDEVKLSAGSQYTIIYDCASHSLQFPGDERLLRHAISNLLTNAVKYSPEGGEIRLKMEHEDTIQIRVSDQGIGIPHIDQPQIFSPFYRATNVNEISGSGLGLSIAKQAVELHGGKLEIAKSDSSGTEFVIDLPID